MQSKDHTHRQAAQEPSSKHCTTANSTKIMYSYSTTVSYEHYIDEQTLSEEERLLGGGKSSSWISFCLLCSEREEIHTNYNDVACKDVFLQKNSAAY